MVDGEGEAEVVEWTPNRAVVDVRGARPGALIAYNMNHDPSWRANGETALEHRGVVAARLESGTERVEFRYFPRTFAWSLPLAALTLLACAWPPAWNLALAGRLGALRSALRRARTAERSRPE